MVIAVTFDDLPLFLMGGRRERPDGEEYDYSDQADQAKPDRSLHYKNRACSKIRSKLVDEDVDKQGVFGLKCVVSSLRLIATVALVGCSARSIR